jgi:DNA repair exonuclease SbcCD nuclease subunit
VISGNHETPRLKETGSVFSLFEHISNVHVVYGNKYELVEIGDGDRNLRIHAIPHCDDIAGEKRKMQVNNDSTDGFNIGVLHVGVYGVGKQTFLMDEFNEQLITIHDLTNFDYIALGHYHKYTRVRDDVYYAGSTERFSFNEVNEDKGFLEVRLSEDGGREVVFHKLRTREMVDLEPVACGALDEHEIKRAITDRIQECNPEDKVVRLKVLDIPVHVYHSLDFDELKRLTRSAVHFEIKYEFLRDSELLAAEQPSFRSLHTEFEHFMEQYAVDVHLDKKRLKELGLQYMQEWERESKE